ncbi:MAG: hypothetical protein MZU91_13345 [Desulfosudis oleivorans]|nr:hypothetical protein [Desulfosudis oleivorans]
MAGQIWSLSSWKDLDQTMVGGVVRVGLSDLEVSRGDTNYVQFRAKDAVGNGYAYSEAYNIWVNTLPVPVITMPESGLVVLEGAYAGVRWPSDR